MKGSEMTLGRYYAVQAVKRLKRAQGLKLQHIEYGELRREANTYLDQHRDELVAR